MRLRYKTSSVIFIFSLLALPQISARKADNPAVKDFASLIPNPSRRLIRLKSNAANKGATKVTIEKAQYGANDEFQAGTGCNPGLTECIIQIGLGYKPRMYEPLIAHELMHIVLNREGYVREPKFPSFIARNPSVPEVDARIAAQLMASVLHPVIDHRIAALGFDPKIPLLVELNSSTAFAHKLSAAPRLDARLAIEEAVHVYSLRKRGMDTSRIEALYRVNQPEVISIEDKLLKAGEGAACTSADSCFALLNRLRDASVLRDTSVPVADGLYEIYFVNPKTGQPQM